VSANFDPRHVRRRCSCFGRHEGAIRYAVVDTNGISGVCFSTIAPGLRP